MLSASDPVKGFLNLRRIALAGQFVVFIAGDRLARGTFNVWPLLTALVVQVLGERATLRWTRAANVRPEVISFGLMVLDCLVLTGLLFALGGDTSPFAVLFLVNIALAGFLLRPRMIWWLGALSVVCFAVVFLVRESSLFGVHETESDPIEWQLREMWVAFTAAAGLLIYFLQQTHRMLLQQRLAMEDVARAMQQKDKLASLATLAAGAAHELGTPLSTIALVANELERALAHADAPPGTLHDAQLIRREVERCRLILGHLATDAGGPIGETPEEYPLAELIRFAMENTGEPSRFRLVLPPDSNLNIRVPRRAFAAAVGAPLRNALQASTPDAPIRVEVSATGSRCRIVIVDQGHGMPLHVLQRAGEPFFTTKQPGAGMGLGLFLTRSFFEQIGGSLQFESEVARGTRITLEMPLTGEAAAASISSAEIDGAAITAEQPPRYSPHNLK